MSPDDLKQVRQQLFLVALAVFILAVAQSGLWVVVLMGGT